MFLKTNFIWKKATTYPKLLNNINRMSNADMYFLLINIITQNNVENKHNIFFSQHNVKQN
jgi:hypothetical protein